MQEQHLTQETWDKKKIAIFLTVLFFLVGGGVAAKTLVLDKNNMKINLDQTTLKKEIQGIATERETSLQDRKDTDSTPIQASFKTGVQQKLDSIKQEITNLNVSEVASSSPQIQKVLKDIQNLEQYPKNQAKDMCKKICDGL